MVSCVAGLRLGDWRDDIWGDGFMLPPIDGGGSIAGTGGRLESEPGGLEFPC